MSDPTLDMKALCSTEWLGKWDGDRQALHLFRRLASFKCEYNIEYVFRVYKSSEAIGHKDASISSWTNICPYFYSCQDSDPYVFHALLTELNAMPLEGLCADSLSLRLLEGFRKRARIRYKKPVGDHGYYLNIGVKNIAAWTKNRRANDKNV